MENEKRECNFWALLLHHCCKVSPDRIPIALSGFSGKGKLALVHRWP